MKRFTWKTRGDWLLALTVTSTRHVGKWCLQIGTLAGQRATFLTRQEAHSRQLLVQTRIDINGQRYFRVFDPEQHRYWLFDNESALQVWMAHRFPDPLASDAIRPSPSVNPSDPPENT